MTVESPTQFPTMVQSEFRINFDQATVNQVRSLASGLSTARYQIGDLMRNVIQDTESDNIPSQEVFERFAEVADVPAELLRQCFRVAYVLPDHSLRAELPWSTALLFVQAGADRERIRQFLSECRANQIPPTYRKAQRFLGSKPSSYSSDALIKRIDADPILAARLRQHLKIAASATDVVAPQPSDRAKPGQHPDTRRGLLTPTVVAATLGRITRQITNLAEHLRPNEIGAAERSVLRHAISDSMVSLTNVYRAIDIDAR